MAKIQVDESMIINAYKLISALEGYDLDEYALNLKNTLETQINAKIDAIKKRSLYTKYKTADTDEEREQARKEYIEFTGMNPDFVY